MLLPPRLSSCVRSVLVVAAASAAAAVLGSAAAASLPPAAGTVQGPAVPASAPGESETGQWVVRLTEPSMAAYLDATGASAAPSAGASYVNYLAGRQAVALEAVEEALGRPVEVSHAYRHVLNAVVVPAASAEAEAMRALPQVDAVYPDRIRELETDASQEVLGAPAVWGGGTGPDLATRGEGVVAGVLDSGVNPDHPAFAETAGDGYTHTNPFGTGVFVGVCDPDHEEHDDICNDKLIGAWDFISDPSGARDANGHGSHTASTMAGNPHEVVIPGGGEEFPRTVQGTAPRANVISYKVCNDRGSCPESAMLAGVDQAVADGVDVLNFSISGSDDPWNDPVDLAFLEATGAGILVSASAGNTGPDDASVTKTGPWNASVAATTNGRILANDLEILAPGPVPPALARVRVWPAGPALAADLTTEVRYALDEGSSTGCRSYPDGAFEGRTALVRITGSFFDCSLSTKVENPAAAGAEAVLLYDSRDQTSPLALGGLAGAPVPAFSIDSVSADVLIDFLRDQDPEPVGARLAAETALVEDPELAGEVGEFSGRGPSQFDVLAPTYAAPGVNVFAAVEAADGDPVRHGFNRGTSMASPHAAGAAALLMSLHPDWSPAQVRSALAATADPEGIRREDGETPAGPFDVGSGRLDLDRAGRVGLVMDETRANFEAADPAAGGDPRTLNLPALVDSNCVRECGWTRLVTNVADTTVDYQARMEAPGGFVATVSPAEFTLAPGEEQVIEVTVDVADLPIGEWQFGDLRLTTGDTHAGGAPVAAAHYPVAVVPVFPVIAVEPSVLTSAQKPDREVVRALRVRSEGNGVLEWRLDTGSAGCAAPEDLGWLAVDLREGAVDPGEWQQIPVTLDTTGLAPQELTATLCVGSNDPDRSLVEVPVTVTVQDLPTMEVGAPDPGHTQPGGTVAGFDLEIANTGTDPLEWQVSLAGDETGAGAAVAGTDPERVELLRDGLLLVGDSTDGNERVMAFDPETGELVDENFIPFQEESGLSTPQHVLLTREQDGFLVSDQNDVVHEYNLDGEWQGVFAPRGGPDPDIIDNVRGIAYSPAGTLLVTSALRGNAHAIAEFDDEGNYLGNFIENGAGGLEGPWYILVRDHDVLVSASRTGLIHRYGLDGTPAPNLPVQLGFPAQIYERDNGNLLVAQFSATGAQGAGVYELDPEGNLLDFHRHGSIRGVYELPGGNLLISSGARNPGVHVVDGETVVDTMFVSSDVRMISPVGFDQGCAAADPAGVPWLDVSPAAGETAPGGAGTVRVRVDSRGLAPGEHTAHVCVSSNDPDNALVEVPVTVTVTEPACDRTVTGRHPGPLAVTGGLTCLAEGADVRGPVAVSGGGSLFASGAAIAGGVSAGGAAEVELRDTTVVGPVSVHGSGTGVVLSGNDVAGPVSVHGNVTGDLPVVVSDNTVRGPLRCTGNDPAPTDLGVPNRVTGPASGQCADLS